MIQRKEIRLNPLTAAAISPERSEDFTFKAIFHPPARVDCIHFGDDFGTQDNLIFSPEIFKRHFKPRYEKLMKPIKEAGIKVSFHSCGQVKDLLPEFADLGINAIWPQLTVYDMQELADTLREMKIALAIHKQFGNTDSKRQSLNVTAF